MSKKAGRLPWMAFDFEDYLEDTEHLTLEQHGAYLLLLARCWKNGWLPDDDMKLASICGCTRTHWLRHIAPAVRAFFHTIGEGRISQKRLEKEREKSRKISEIAAENARKKHGKSIDEYNQNNDLGSAPVDAEEQPQLVHIQLQVHKQLDSVDSDSKESTNQPLTDSVPAPARKIARLHMDSPRSEWVALALSVDPTATVRKEDPQHRANPAAMMPQDEVYLGPQGYRRGFYFAARKLTQAARQPERWTCDWTVLARWMIEGYDINEDIAPLVSAMAAEKTYPKDNLNSLNFFSKKLHQLTPFAKRESEKPSPLDFVLRRVVNN